jgi:hypothetical protein
MSEYQGKTPIDTLKDERQEDRTGPFLGNGYQWDGEGHKERVKEGEFDSCISCSCKK